MILITNWWNESNQQRRKELDKCLDINCKNTHIKQVWLLVEDKCTYTGSKYDSLVLFHVGYRMTYNEIFGLVNNPDQFSHEHTQPVKNPKPIIIANADIYFDHSAKYFDEINYNKLFISMSKYNTWMDWNYPPGQSQDVWAYSPPLPRSLSADFTMGTPGCESRLCWIAKESGLRVVNPHKSIKAHHLHETGIRNYNSQRIQPPYHTPEERTIEELR